MAILQVNNINKNFLGEEILKDISFSIDEKDKIGLIGINGAGKTTLVKILIGEEDDDVNIETKLRGNISRKSGLKIGYLSQNFDLNKNNTIFQELMSVFQERHREFLLIQELSFKLTIDEENYEKHIEELANVQSRYEQEGGYSIEYKVKQILNGLSLREELWNNKIQDLSGGQASRVALGKILLEEPELLILDEPTNHLDLQGIEWLEGFLKDYKKAIIIISHDTLFLDEVTNRILEIEGKKIWGYKGNYTDYKIQKEAYLTGAVKRFEKEQDKIKKMEDFIIKYKAGIKSKQARGREKILNRMEKMENPLFKIRKIKLKFKVKNPSSDRVLRIEKLSKSYDSLQLFENLTFDVYRGDRIGIIGKNGVGKSTLLKIINGVEKSDTGTIQYGEKLKIGYYDQNHNSLTMNNTILEELMNSAPLTYEEGRTLAGSFLFTEDDVDKKISTLSGGERARIEFMKLILKEPNFLIFDEPTNHLDIYSREILEEALEEYDGTLIVVSHDRMFLEEVVNKVYEIGKDGITIFNGDYHEYVNRKVEKVKEDKKGASYEEQKKNNNRIGILQRKKDKLEEQIERYETEKKILEELFHKAGRENNLEKILSAQKELENMDMKILSLMEEWENMELELERLTKSE